MLLPQSRGVVLDVGSGAQPYRHLLSPGATYKAIDYGGAERNFGYSMPDTTYYEGDNWPVPDGSVDVILCTETLEHVPDPSVFPGRGISVPETRGATPPARSPSPRDGTMSRTITGGSHRRGWSGYFQPPASDASLSTRAAMRSPWHAIR